MELKEFATINMGQSPKGETYNTDGNGMPFLQGRKTFGRIYPTIDTWTTDPIKIANKDEILMSVRAPVGDMNFANKEICIGRGLCSISAKNGRNKYLYYMLLNSMNDLKRKSTGTVFDSINRKDLENLEINFHSEEEQEKIEKILESLDDKIELNNEINNNLYEEAVSLYKDKFKGIGQGKKTIGDYIVPKRGKNLLTRDAIDGDTPVVAGGIAPSAYHNQFNTKSPVITISASGANAGYTNLWNIPVWASDCSYIDDSITKNVYFWYIVLKTRQNEIFDAQTGSAQPHIYPQHIAEISIGELNIAEVEKYNNLVAPLFKMIGENQKENKKLSQLRDTLLPKLMDGEIDLDNIEI